MLDLFILSFIIICILILTIKLKINTIFLLFVSAIIFTILSNIDANPILSLNKLFTEGFGEKISIIGPIILSGGFFSLILIRLGIIDHFIELLLRNIALFYMLLPLIFMVISGSTFFEVAFILYIPVFNKIKKIDTSNKFLISNTMLTLVSMALGHILFFPTPPLILISDIFQFDLKPLLLLSFYLISFTLISVMSILFYIHYHKSFSKIFINHQVKKIEVSKIIFFILPFSSLVLISIISSFSTNPVINLIGNPTIFFIIWIFLLLFFNLLFRWSILSDIFDQDIWTTYMQKVFNIIGLLATSMFFSYSIFISDIKQFLSDIFHDSNSKIGILLLSFFIAMVFRISIGSATTAIISSSSMIFPAINGYNDIYTISIILSILAGGTSVSHLNDGGFWLVYNNFADNEIKKTFKIWTVPVLLMSLCLLLTSVIIMIFS